MWEAGIQKKMWEAHIITDDTTTNRNAAQNKLRNRGGLPLQGILAAVGQTGKNSGIILRPLAARPSTRGVKPTTVH